MLKTRNSIIIHKTTSFSCFGGLIRGQLEGDIYDKGNDVFPVHMTARTNLGDGSIDFELKGNETITEEIQGITIKVDITQWKVDEKSLSFHVKGVAKKLFFSCTIIDETFKGNRYDTEAFSLLMVDLNKKLGALSA